MAGRERQPYIRLHESDSGAGFQNRRCEECADKRDIPPPTGRGARAGQASIRLNSAGRGTRAENENVRPPNW
jgi:hypothetical protein